MYSMPNGHFHSDLFLRILLFQGNLGKLIARENKLIYSIEDVHEELICRKNIFDKFTVFLT